MVNPNYELMQTQQKFKFYYDKNLQGKYADLEIVRYKYMRMFFKRIAITVVTIFALYVLIITNILPSTIYESELFINVMVIIALIDFFVLYYPFSEYKHQSKSAVMQKILSFWGSFAYKNSSSFINKNTIKNSELFSYYNKEIIDDSFSGKYKDTTVSVSEHDLRIHGRKGDTIIYRGIFILLEFDKNFKGKTVVKSKWRNCNFILNNPWLVFIMIMCCVPVFTTIYYGLFSLSGIFFSFLPILFPVALIGLIYTIYRHFNPKKATQKVVLEKIDFLKNWLVYSSDQIEARYILTPRFMEQIDEVKHLFHGKFIDFSFFNNKLLIAIHTRKNLFETTFLFSSALRYHKIRKVVTQLHSIFTLIDIIKNK